MMSMFQKTDVNVIEVASGSYHMTALDDDGYVYTWGDAVANYLGRSITNNSIATRLTEWYAGYPWATYGALTIPPTIKQISCGWQTTVALDVDGNIYTWGTSYNGYNGSSASNRPTRVRITESGNEVKFKYVTGGYNGAKAVDTHGHIWVWGLGNGYALGTGSISNVSTPTMLTLDSNNTDITNIKFKAVESCDYIEECCAMAQTENNEIYTWGNNNSASIGGSMRPKLVTGIPTDIKKIIVGNGAYGFLTESGDIWTWGNNTQRVIGRLGLGYTTTANVSTPTKITMVSVASTGATYTAAPKFKNFSLYAWSLIAVDYNGQLYGCGQALNNKHGNIGSRNVLSPFTFYYNATTRTGPMLGKSFIISEGWEGTSYVDQYGNLYAEGRTMDQGGSTAAEPWVHFTSKGAPLFSLLTSTPDSQQHYYGGSSATLDVGVTIAANEVKYVLLYDTDIDKETYYDKTFAELDELYLNKGTDPQLLLSPNYNLESSKFYANPKISEVVFEAAWDSRTGSDKGLMSAVAGSANKLFKAFDTVTGNCVVWVQTKNAAGTHRMVYRFENYYKQTVAYYEGVKVDDPNFKLYYPELIPGSYGLYTNNDGTIYQGEPPLGYDIVQPIHKELDYWQLSPSNQEALNPVDEDGYIHRSDPTKEVFLDSESKMGDSVTKTPLITFTYAKDPAKWVNATIKYVDVNGNPLPGGVGTGIDQETKTQFAPLGAEHVLGQDLFTPPDAVDTNFKPVGYKLDSAPATTTDYTSCTFPNGFNAVFTSNNQTIYIIYSAGMIDITETFWEITGDSPVQISDNNNQFQTVKNLKANIENYDFAGPKIQNYVLVGHEILDPHSIKNYTWNHTTERYDIENAFIFQVPAPTTIKFYYKKDTNNDGIPDGDEGIINVHWIAVDSNDRTNPILSKSFIGNAAQASTKHIDEDKYSNFPIDYYKPDGWIFNPSATGAPYVPAGIISPIEVTFSSTTKTVYFYYDEDSNENGTADKLEGNFTEKYKLSPEIGGGDLVPPRADTVSKWLGGQTYYKEAPLISDYVSVGYIIEADGNIIESVERVARDETGNVTVVYNIPFSAASVNYTVTFLYKEDKNNDNIPDDEGGLVIISWIGTTYAGNHVELAKLVIDDYIGTDVTNMIYPPVPIDSVWNLTGSNLPAKILVSNTPQAYEYQYTEILDFSIITIEGSSTDGELNFYYQQKKKLSDEDFDVTAFVIPTYKVTGYVLYDNYNNEISSGTGDALRITPSNGNQRVVFMYNSTITTVVIRAVEAGDNTNILQRQIITDAVVGQKYSARALYIDETWALTGEILQVIDVAQGTNYITFEYEKVTGNVTVLLKENNTDGPVIKVLSETVTKGETKTIQIPDLTGYYYTTISMTAQNVNYSGTVPEPQTVEYYYSKDKMDILIRAIDTANKSVLKTVSYTETARKGESFTALAPSVEWYTLIEPNTKSVYANPSATDNTVKVDFEYKKDDIANISVKYFYIDENGIEVDMQTQMSQGIIGSKYTAYANIFTGYTLVSEGAVEIIINSDESKNMIKFEYTDVRKTVEIFTQIGSDDTTLQKVTTNKYVSGSEDILIPPYMCDHLVIGYKIDAAEIVDVDPKNFTGLDFTGEKVITSDMRIVFIYETVEDIVDCGCVSITVIGKYTGGELYRYSISKPKNSGDFEIYANVVSEYNLISANPAIINVGTEDETIIFDYESVYTTVTINMIDEDTLQLLAIFEVTAVTGETFIKNAPSIVGYYLTSASTIGTISPVPAKGEGKITFMYKKITSNVVIVARENDTNGRVIRIIEVDNPQIGTFTINAPDLTADSYTALSQTVSITYDGINSVRAEVYYTKD